MAWDFSRACGLFRFVAGCKKNKWKERILLNRVHTSADAIVTSEDKSKLSITRPTLITRRYFNNAVISHPRQPSLTSVLPRPRQNSGVRPLLPYLGQIDFRTFPTYRSWSDLCQSKHNLPQKPSDKRSFNDRPQLLIGFEKVADKTIEKFDWKEKSELT